MSYKRAFLFANGSVADIDQLATRIRKTDLLVAVDGGLRYLKKIKRLPDMLIGDLDSVSEQDIRWLKKERVEIRKFPTHKDETDLELALKMVRELKITEAVILGATGDRLDHTLGNIHLLTKYQSPTLNLYLDDGKQEIFLVKNRSTIHGKPKDIISLIPLEVNVSGISTHRLSYPLSNETLFRDNTRGISNEMLGKTATVLVKKGLLLCIHIRV